MKIAMALACGVVLAACWFAFSQTVEWYVETDDSGVLLLLVPLAVVVICGAMLLGASLR